MKGGRRRAVFRYVARTATGTVLVTLLADFGMPALGALVSLVIMALAVTCWILASPDRSERICRMLLAGRGDPRCLASEQGTLPPRAGHPTVGLAAPPTEQSQRLLLPASLMRRNGSRQSLPCKPSAIRGPSRRRSPGLARTVPFESEPS